MPRDEAAERKGRRAPTVGLCAAPEYSPLDEVDLESARKRARWPSGDEMQEEFSPDPSDVESLDDVLYTFGGDPEEGTITEIDEDDQLVRISGPHGQSDVVGFDELRQGMVVPKDEALEPAWVDEYEQAAERHRELSGGDDGYWDCYEEAQEALPFDVEDTVGYEGETYTVSAFDPARGDASVELADPLESADTRWVEPTAVDPSAEPTTAGLDQPNTPTIPDLGRVLRYRPRQARSPVVERRAVAGAGVLEVVDQLEECPDTLTVLSGVVTAEPVGGPQVRSDADRQVAEERRVEAFVDVDRVSGRVPRRVEGAEAADVLPVGDGADGEVREGQAAVEQAVDRAEHRPSVPGRQAVAGDEGRVGRVDVHRGVQFGRQPRERPHVVDVVVRQEDAVDVGRDEPRRVEPGPDRLLVARPAGVDERDRVVVHERARTGVDEVRVRPVAGPAVHVPEAVGEVRHSVAVRRETVRRLRNRRWSVDGSESSSTSRTRSVPGPLPGARRGRDSPSTADTVSGSSSGSGYPRSTVHDSLPSAHTTAKWISPSTSSGS